MGQTSLYSLFLNTQGPKILPDGGISVGIADDTFGPISPSVNPGLDPGPPHAPAFVGIPGCSPGDDVAGAGSTYPPLDLCRNSTYAAIDLCRQQIGVTPNR